MLLCCTNYYHPTPLINKLKIKLISLKNCKLKKKSKIMRKQLIARDGIRIIYFIGCEAILFSNVIKKTKGNSHG